MNTQGPALFFFVNEEFLFHGCALEDGELYGNFINYPQSHDKVWNENYAQKYCVDFDYFPRGRVVYRKSDNTYLIYYDKCIENSIEQICSRYEKYITVSDEHYQCYICNPFYVI